jgi:signal peptidase II
VLTTLAAALVAMVFILLYARRTRPEERWLRLDLALVFGGALGNFLDRLHLGYVIDFIEWHWLDKATWPLFNVADAAISTGVALLFLSTKRPAAQ